MVVPWKILVHDGANRCDDGFSLHVKFALFKAKNVVDDRPLSLN